MQPATLSVEPRPRRGRQAHARCTQHVESDDAVHQGAAPGRGTGQTECIDQPGGAEDACDAA
eukprot:2612450-Pyramimonas_sp.AAC.1